MKTSTKNKTYTILKLFLLINDFKMFRNFAVKNVKLGLPWWSSGLDSASQCRGHRFDF